MLETAEAVAGGDAPDTRLKPGANEKGRVCNKLSGSAGRRVWAPGRLLLCQPIKYCLSLRVRQALHFFNRELTGAHGSDQSLRNFARARSVYQNFDWLIGL